MDGMKHKITGFTYLLCSCFSFSELPLWPRSADSCPYVNTNVCQERLYITRIEPDNEQEGRTLFNTPLVCNI